MPGYMARCKESNKGGKLIQQQKINRLVQAVPLYPPTPPGCCMWLFQYALATLHSKVCAEDPSCPTCDM